MSFDPENRFESGVSFVPSKPCQWSTQTLPLTPSTLPSALSSANRPPGRMCCFSTSSVPFGIDGSSWPRILSSALPVQPTSVTEAPMIATIATIASFVLSSPASDRADRPRLGSEPVVFGAATTTAAAWFRRLCGGGLCTGGPSQGRLAGFGAELCLLVPVRGAAEEQI